MVGLGPRPIVMARTRQCSDEPGLSRTPISLFLYSLIPCYLSFFIQLSRVGGSYPDQPA